MPAPDALRALVEWVAPAGEALGLSAYLGDVERLLTEGNGAQVQGRALAHGSSVHDVHAATVARANAIVDGEGR